MNITENVPTPAEAIIEHFKVNREGTVTNPMMFTLNRMCVLCIQVTSYPYVDVCQLHVITKFQIKYKRLTYSRSHVVYLACQTEVT